MYKGNDLSDKFRHMLRDFKWSPNNVLDLHQMGVHFFDEDILPPWVDPMTYSAILHRGLTPPMALPIYIPDNYHEKINHWLDFNYFRLAEAGLHHLGTEFNVMTEEEWKDDQVHVCFLRLSEYETVDGSFGGYLINNWIRDFSEGEIFIDFCFLPPIVDVSKYINNDIPLYFGSITKRPMTDFDIIVTANIYPAERVNIPLTMVKSGVPLHRHERFDKNLPYRDKSPITCVAGIGACFEADTLIRILPEGNFKEIQDINVGDEILSYNVNDKIFEEDLVSSIDNSLSNKIILELIFKDDQGEYTIRCTDDHKFFTENRGWVEAKDLTEDDEIGSYKNTPKEG